MQMPKDVGTTPRLTEFIASKFYADDFITIAYRSITVRDGDENEILHFTHFEDEKKRGRYWVTQEGEKITVGTMIDSFVLACEVFEHVYLDIDVNDMFKHNPRLRAHRVLRYHMWFAPACKKTWGGNTHESKIERLYNVESVSDVKAFHSLKQVMNPACL